MKPVYCFIDDSEFELKLMKDVIASSEPGVEFICAETYDKCRDELNRKGRYPALFILDLYGNTGELKEDDIPSIETLRAKSAEIGYLDSIYNGLDSFSGQAKAQEYLKRLFRVVKDWRDVHTEVFTAMGHSIDFGLKNLKRARKDFPFTPCVFYTRKSTIDDAVALFDLKPEGLMLKPTGPSGSDIPEYTAEKAPELIGKWKEILGNHIFLLLEEFTDGQIQADGDNFDSDTVEELIELLSADEDMNIARFADALRAIMEYLEE